jgi:V8-like Glu-specific endopeptidase
VTISQLQHQCDTFGGDSGSALWVEADGGFQIAAVHIGRPADSTGYNLATELNAAMRGFVFRSLLNDFDELTAMQYLG